MVWMDETTKLMTLWIRDIYFTSKPAESPTTFEEREKRLQKEYSCVDNLNEQRISPNDTSFLVKRRRISPECLAFSSVPTAITHRTGKLIYLAMPEKCMEIRMWQTRLQICH
ncbi:hypothetical protein CDAR_58721 [Caerostris darwini]|uniref:Uncharacterized protein n=1 Tax=Caerostris darwini TaxID=1538125 RepID=A0AAV4S5I4_9ARAC|nr:hypothetical protein CDAR_58721 [Caerostris darwini]